MSMSKSYPHNIGGTVFAVVSGRGGNCLVLGDENGGTRISGPKPLGGGRTIMEFVTDEEYGPTEVLESENARLRELVKAAWHCVNRPFACYECRVVAGGCTLMTAMRELGIEVPR